MSKIIGIYKITSPTGKIYIGQSRNIADRKQKYKKCKPDQPRIYRSIKKYGWEAHVFEIIEQCSLEDLNCRERYWQEFYDVLGENGLNCLLVESDEKPMVNSEETTIKLRKATSGKNNPMYGKGCTQERRERISIAKKQSGKVKGEGNPMYGKRGELNPNFGKKSSEETKALLRERQQRGNNPRAKIVLDLETGIFYDCLRDAAEAKNLNRYTLAQKLRGLMNNNTNFIYV